MSTKAQAAQRLVHVDVLRGLAVVFMLTLHTAHGWLEPAARTGAAEVVIRTVGGMAAPLFLWLSGVSLGLRAQLRATRGQGTNAGAEVARGLQLVALGYLLRVQMWMLDGGGFIQPAAWVAALPMAAGELVLYAQLGRIARSERPRAAAVAAAALLVSFGLYRVATDFPARFNGLLRVDVLQAIGASLALAAAPAIRLQERPALLYALGAATACLTPLMRMWVPGPLPQALAAYVALWPAPAGAQPMAMFPLFPWLSYVFVGAALGPRWGREATRRGLTRVVLRGALLGAVLALTSWEGHRAARLLLAELPALSQPVRVLHRVGLGLVLTAPALWAARLPWLSGPLRTLGGASLLVYWVHLEFAFGRAADPIRRSLPLPAWGLALLLLTAAMTWLAALRLRRLRTGKRSGAPPISTAISTSTPPHVNSET